MQKYVKETGSSSTKEELRLASPVCHALIARVSRRAQEAMEADKRAIS